MAKKEIYFVNWDSRARDVKLYWYIEVTTKKGSSHESEVAGNREILQNLPDHASAVGWWTPAGSLTAYWEVNPSKYAYAIHSYPNPKSSDQAPADPVAAGSVAQWRNDSNHSAEWVLHKQGGPVSGVVSGGGGIYSCVLPPTTQYVGWSVPYGFSGRLLRQLDPKGAQFQMTLDNVQR
jgi:hypothetical protein